MRILLLDLESSPNLAYVWGLWNQNIAINQIHDAGSTLCWAAKWLGEDEILFSSVRDNGPKKMLLKIHSLLNQADAVIHYNGTRYDMPTLNREFISHDINPPSPYKQIDLLKVARNKFRFVSNKLDYIAQKLGLGQKVRHKGFELWVDCMKGDEESWAKMKEYNIGDVTILEKLYYKFLPWIPNHPNRSVYLDADHLICPNCGSDHLNKRGFYHSNSRRYQQYQCQYCGKWSKSNKSVPFKGERLAHVS